MAEYFGPEVSPFRAGLTCKCPRCGQGRLFQGYLKLAERCPSCDLDYAAADSGDGPAVFVILILGFVVVAGALAVEIMYQPPYWLHAALWLPSILVGAAMLLRPFKATLIALQFRHKATSNIEVG